MRNLSGSPSYSFENPHTDPNRVMFVLKFIERHSLGHWSSAFQSGESAGSAQL
jgi:hypothetical protein